MENTIEFETKFLEFAENNGLIIDVDRALIKSLTITCEAGSIPLVKTEYYVTTKKIINWRKVMKDEEAK